MDLMPALGRARLGRQVRGFETLLPQTFGKLRRKRVLLGRKVALGSPQTKAPPTLKDQTQSLKTLPEVNAQSEERRVAGAELPREALGPKSPRTVMGQDARSLGCWPSPHAESWRGLRSELSPGRT